MELSGIADLFFFRTAGTPGQCVKHALRLTRKRRLTEEQYEFVNRWLTYGLAHLTVLRLEDKEQALRQGLDQPRTPAAGAASGWERAEAWVDDRIFVPAAMGWAALTGAAGHRPGDLPERRDILIAIAEARLSTLNGEQFGEVQMLLRLGEANIAGYRLERHEDELIAALHSMAASN